MVNLLTMSTIFKKIIEGEISANIIYQNDYVLCFEDINPVAPNHILIIPKVEIPTINDISSEHKEMLGEMMLAGKKVAKMLKIDKSGYRLVFNCNDDAGQTVFHIHMHLLGGRKLGWPPG